ncbi:MAG: DegT/DnrJ/EryC1/StrS family aminotransferase [Chloroflexi bacterium]|nr:DegT/DnrJ/EryC1/StrS family aminotransferase [Chloroflexota bacterium]MCL5076412.1 DegT/DnrJ/EryC1/StrS family aminotransferase [Chloroflexota bacterium]
MIPVFKPSVDEEELEALREVLASGWIGLGPKTKEFEQQFANYIGTKYAVGFNSATAALHMSVVISNLGPGDEVISPSLTFISTNHVILYVGATPVFADIEEDTLCVSPADIERKITAKTRAIMVVHYGGHPCDMDPIMEIARARGITVIEDAAHACGSEYKGRKAGTLGNLGCFSFHAVKNLTTGEGGMITTNSEEEAKRLLKLRWMGITKDTWKRSETGERYSWYYEVEEVGFKNHMSDIAAAIGIIQLRKLAQSNARRRQIVKQYSEAFADLDWLQTPVEKEWAKSACHNYVVKVEKRDRFMAHLQEAGIASSVHYIPNHHYAMYKQYSADVPLTERVWTKLVTLPLYPDLTASDSDRIITAVRSFKP